MSATVAPAPADANAEIARLIDVLHDTDQRLEELLEGEVDSVTNRAGRTILLRHAQGDLRRSESVRQAAVLAALPANIALLDAGGVIISVNKAWREFADANGLATPAHAVGANYLQVCDAALGLSAMHAGEVAAGVRSVLNGSAAAFSIEYPCHSPTQQRYFQLRAVPLASDAAKGAVVMHIDITERWQAAQDLAALSTRTELRERQFSTALASIPDFVTIYDRQGRLVFVNQPLLDLWGMTLEQAVGRGFGELAYPPELAAKLGRQVAHVFDSKESIADETPFPGSGGVNLWYEYIFSAALAANGEVDFVVGSTRDISERKRAEHTLRESEVELRTLAESMPQIVWTGTSDGQVTYTNTRWLEYTGLGATETLGEGWSGPVHPDDRARMREAWRAAVAARSIYAVELRLRRADGKYRWWLTRAVPLLDDEGGVLKWVGTGTDIQGLKEMNAELEARVEERTAELTLAREQAESASKAKSHFLATMSHEIRTPMNGVIGMIEVLQQSSLQQHQVEMTELIRDSAYSLLQIIEDILDFSKIEAGALQVRDEPMRLRECVEKVCGVLDHLAIKQGVRLTVFVDPALPDVVVADEGRLRQVLLNLIGNAIKFSGSLDRVGRVSVRAVLVPGSRIADSVCIDFTVVDNGIGIDEPTLARLFRPFAEADDSTTRRYGGSGLGLVISEMLVRLMGGDVSVQSALGRGATFSIRLQLQVREVLPLASPIIESLRHMRCLVVGADREMGDDLAACLSHAGMTLSRASGIAQAASVPRAAGESFWLVLPDSKPTPGDLQALRKALVDSRIHLVVLGWGRRRIPRHEAQGLVLVDANVLSLSMLLRAVALAAEELSSDPATPPPVAARPRGSGLGEQPVPGGPIILVAEDNQTNRLVILKQLALLGFAAEVAGDGLDALARWRAGSYALVLTDLHMPGMDGYGLAQAIRAEEAAGCHIPIIAVTANALRDEELRCLAIGMDAYLSKPVLLNQLKSAIDTHIRPPAAPLPQVASDKPPVLRLQTLLEIVGDDPDELAQVLQSFSRSARSSGAALDAAMQGAGFPEVAGLAHQLKGAAASVGAVPLAQACDDLELAARAGTADELKGLHGQVREELAAVLVFIDQHHRVDT